MSSDFSIELNPITDYTIELPDQGPMGPQGPKGDRGEQGATGPQGPQGIQGEAATIAVGTVTQGAEGTQPIITNSGTANEAVFDFTIPKGDTGAQGEAATIELGAVSTGEPNTDVVITNTGTAQEAVFNFTIPKGEKGDKGETGDVGTAATIAVGTTTTSTPGGNANVVNSGTSLNAVLDFTIPRGEQGPAATIQVGTVTTGAPGTDVEVTNTGTSGAAILNFTIPQGATGEKGDKGDTGETGTTGEVGPQGPQGLAATVDVGETTTLLPTENASVTNTGTTSAAVFNFAIPRGKDGGIGVDYTEQDETITFDWFTSNGMPAGEANWGGIGGTITNQTDLVQYVAEHGGGDPYVLPAATTTTLGGVKPDGSTITVTGDGTISAVGGGSSSGSVYVTEASDDGVYGYRLWSNGTLECWGGFSVTSNTKGAILFPKEFKTNSYCVVITPWWEIDPEDFTGGSVWIYSRQTGSIARWCNNGPDGAIFWYAVGEAAT